MRNPFFRPRHWITPPASILPDSSALPESGAEYAAESVAALITTLGAPCIAINQTVGASVVQYHCNLVGKTSIGKVKRILPDIAARLMRQITLDTSNVAHFALTVNRLSRETVPFKRVLLTQAFDALKSHTAAILGASPSGSIIALNVADMPHMLIAGATGSGKSVALHTLLCSMLFKGTPDRLKLLMLDPKQTELTMYDGLPHLLRPVITEVPAAVAALECICAEMDGRYRQIRRGKTDFPRIIVIIDELADLMIKSRALVEESIIRLAQKGRACGIHLIIATQQPRASIVTGLIRANIPCKIALKCASAIDSRIVLGHNGAECLTGKGDALLCLPSDATNFIRFQVAFTSESDIRTVVNYWKSKDCIFW